MEMTGVTEKDSIKRLTTLDSRTSTEMHTELVASRQHYIRDIRARIESMLTPGSNIAGSSRQFQHTLNNNRRQGVAVGHLQRFDEAMTLKLAGYFESAQRVFGQLLKESDIPPGARAEVHFQLGDIQQFLDPDGSDWTRHMVACRTFHESHFRAFNELERFFDRTGSLPAERPDFRILLVLGSNSATVAFANAFMDRWPVVGIVQQYTFFPRLPREWAPKGGLPYGLSEEEAQEFSDEGVLGNRWNALFLNEKIPQLCIRRGEANTSNVMSWVESLRPDLIVSHGPERLGSKFISLARLGGINVHWGLSPTYRGMDTARWPLLQGKPEWIGLTLHHLDPGLDSGPILYQAKPDLVSGDTFRQIEYRLTNLACEIMPVAVDDVVRGRAHPVSQELSKGRQYWMDEWNKRYEKILTVDYIRDQIKRYHADKEARDQTVPLINPWNRQ